MHQRAKSTAIDWGKLLTPKTERHQRKIGSPLPKSAARAPKSPLADATNASAQHSTSRANANANTKGSVKFPFSPPATKVRPAQAASARVAGSKRTSDDTSNTSFATPVTSRRRVERWECGACKRLNDASAENCGKCCTPKKSWNTTVWSCASCLFLNERGVNCDVCGTPQSAAQAQHRRSYSGSGVKSKLNFANDELSGAGGMDVVVEGDREGSVQSQDAAGLRRTRSRTRNRSMREQIGSPGCQREMSSVADLLSSDDLTSSAENSDAGPSLLSSAQKRRHAARSERRRHRMTRQMAQQGGMDKQQQQQGAGEPSSADTMQAELAKQALNRKKQQYLERAKKAYAAKKQHEAEQREQQRAEAEAKIRAANSASAAADAARDTGTPAPTNSGRRGAKRSSDADEGHSGSASKRRRSPRHVPQAQAQAQAQAQEQEQAQAQAQQRDMPPPTRAAPKPASTTNNAAAAAPKKVLRDPLATPAKILRDPMATPASKRPLSAAGRRARDRRSSPIKVQVDLRSPPPSKQASEASSNSAINASAGPTTSSSSGYTVPMTGPFKRTRSRVSAAHTQAASAPAAAAPAPTPAPAAAAPSTPRSAPRTPRSAAAAPSTPRSTSAAAAAAAAASATEAAAAAAEASAAAAEVVNRTRAQRSHRAEMQSRSSRSNSTASTPFRSPRHTAGSSRYMAEDTKTQKASDPALEPAPGPETAPETIRRSPRVTPKQHQQQQQEQKQRTPKQRTPRRSPRLSPKKQQPQSTPPQQQKITSPAKQAVRQPSPVRLSPRAQKAADARSRKARCSSLDQKLALMREQVNALFKLPQAQRKKEQRKLFLFWHPDKNIDDQTDCTEVVKVLQIEIKRGPYVKRDTSCAPPTRPYAGGNLEHARRWYGQASYDMGVLRTLHQAKHHSSVCFMSFHLVEKALKALVCTTQKLQLDDAESVQLMVLFHKIDKSVQAQLPRDDVGKLGDFRVATHNPTRWGSGIPADQYTQKDADMCMATCEKVLEISTQTLELVEKEVDDWTNAHKQWEDV